MKTILSRMKTLVNDNIGSGQTLSYVRYCEIIHPDLAITDFPNQVLLPSVFLSPVGTVETWESTQRKKAEHRVNAYLMMYYTERELNIIGDSTRGQNGKGILDFEEDFLTVFRGHRLAVGGVQYLDKPLDVENIERFPSEPNENVFLITSKIVLYCTRLFLQTSLPGNI